MRDVFGVANSSILCSVYTGYLDVDYGAKHLFFYFFESRRDPDNGESSAKSSSKKLTRSLQTM